MLARLTCCNPATMRASSRKRELIRCCPLGLTPPAFRCYSCSPCSHIVRPDNIQGSVDVMLFRDGIKPMWEDDANARGGKWTLRLKKGVSSAFWEEIVSDTACCVRCTPIQLMRLLGVRC